MKKSLLGVVAVIVLISLGWWFLLRSGRVAVKRGQAAEGMDDYKVFTGTKPRLMVTFEYPGPWALQEEQGRIEFYREARILGPRNHDDTYTAYFSVRGSPLKPFGGQHESVEDLVRHYRSHLSQGTQIVSEQQVTVAGHKASDLTISLTMPAMHHKGIKAMEVPLRTRTVLVEKTPYLYELTYSADAREYDRYAEAFERLIKTFRFQ